MTENLPTVPEPPKPAPNWMRAGVKAIPYLGPTLDELLYGRLDEARWSRVEHSLRELGELMRDRGIPAAEAEKEEFGRLLEDVAPSIARATSERKRVFLRDLLLNAVSLGRQDPSWESARLAAALLASLDFAAIEILAALHRLGATTRSSLAELRLPATPEKPSVVLQGSPDKLILLSYDKFVVEQGYKQLTDTAARLVVVGAHGRDTYESVSLTELGNFVIEWATTDKVPKPHNSSEVEA